MKNPTKVKGVISLNGRRFFEITIGGSTLYEPYQSFAGERAAIRKRLEIVNTGVWKSIERQVEEVKRFREGSLVEQPGWTGQYFALPDGTVYGPDRNGRVLFAPNTEILSKNGSLASWQAEVAALLVKQHLLTFVIMAAFAAPLLSLTNRVNNIGFELVGKGGCGKSTAQYVMASAFGPALLPEGNYWTSFNKTIAGIEAMVGTYNHLPLIFDEANLIAGSRTTKERSDFRALVFKMSEGATKVTALKQNQTSFRTVWLTSANEPLASLIAGGDSNTNQAASDRLITLLIDDEREYGTFDFLPSGLADANQLADRLKEAISNNYGVAGRAFIKKLVKDRATDEGALRQRIQRYMSTFKSKIIINRNDGSASRVAEAFGLVYAAGMMAKRYGVLPKEYQCLAAAKQAYAMHPTRCALPTLDEELERLASLPSAYRTSPSNLPEVSDDDFASSAVFVRIGKQKRGELLVSKTALRALSPHASRLIKMAKRQSRLICEKDRTETYRKVRKGKRDRVHVFLLTAS